MADKVEKPKEVEEVKKSKPVEDEEPEAEAKETVKNGDEKAEENGDEKQTETEEKTEDKCTIKRKSTGGNDATDNATAEDQPTPEKKAKVSEPTEVDGKEETKAAA